VTNHLKNVCGNSNTHSHGGVHLVVLAHLQRRSVGVELDQLGEEKMVFWCTLNYRMALGLEFCIDPLFFGSNM
jgi:hypothetical protein